MIVIFILYYFCLCNVYQRLLWGLVIVFIHGRSLCSFIHGSVKSKVVLLFICRAYAGSVGGWPGFKVQCMLQHWGSELLLKELSHWPVSTHSITDCWRQPVLRVSYVFLVQTLHLSFQNYHKHWPCIEQL